MLIFRRGRPIYGKTVLHRYTLSGKWVVHKGRHDLHPYAQPGRKGCQEPCGQFLEGDTKCFIQKPYIPPGTVQNTA